MTHIPVAKWICSSSPISEARRKVLRIVYGDAVVISRRKAVISGDPRQVLPRRAAIPAVNRTPALSTCSVVSVESPTARDAARVSHFISLSRFSRPSGSPPSPPETLAKDGRSYEFTRAPCTRVRSLFRLFVVRGVSVAFRFYAYFRARSENILAMKKRDLSGRTMCKMHMLVTA